MAAQGSAAASSVSVLVRSTYLKLLQQTAQTVRIVALTHAHGSNIASDRQLRCNR